MTSTITQNGVTYVDRNYKCLDCDWAWNQITVLGDSEKATCPNCQNVDRNRFTKPDKDDKIKSTTGKKRPKKHDIDWKNPKIHVTSEKGRRTKKAAELAFSEAEKQGFTDMKDSGLRQGDICAPKLNSLVSTVQDNVFKGGWTGGQASPYAGHPATDAGGRHAMGALQGGIINGQVADPLRGVGDLKK